MKRFYIVLAALLGLAVFGFGITDLYDLGTLRPGQIDQFNFTSKFGQNTDIDTAAEEDVASIGGTFVIFPDDSAMEAVSSSTADDTSGTGARTVTVFGIDSSWTRVSETFSLGGQDTVNLANNYVMIYRAFVDSAGTGLTNAGTINFQTQVGNTVILNIQAGLGQTTHSIMPVPQSETGYILSYGGGIIGTVAANVVLKLVVKPFNKSFQTKHFLPIRGGSTSIVGHDFSIPLKVAEKSLVKLVGSTGTNNTNLIGFFEMRLRGAVE